MKYPIEDPDQQKSRSRVLGLLGGAFTRAEVDAARAAYAAHIALYPDDERRDLAHGFGHTVEYLKEREAESERLGLTADQYEARENLIQKTGDDLRKIDPAEDRNALDKYAAVKARLQDWLAKHPGDKNILAQIGLVDNDVEIAMMFRDVIFGATEAPRELQLA